MDKQPFAEYIKIFLEKNSRLNLISKNDEKFLWEKHICDSLAIGEVFKRYGTARTFLDIGTGGGFPAVPVAIAYPEIEVFALDSIRKKINAIKETKQELGLKNLHPVCGRAGEVKTLALLSDTHENTGLFTPDVVAARAVAPLKVLIDYAMPLTGRYFAAYKSVKVQEEINEAAGVLKKHHAKIIDIIEYTLPLEQNHRRNIVVMQGNTSLRA